MRGLASCVTLLVLVALLGCYSPEAPELGGDAAATWRIDSAPFIDIGGQESDTAAILDRPHTAAMVDDSLVVIADFNYPALRYYNRAGELVRTIGRRGDGPGEFRTVSRLRHCGDSLHVYDQRHGRVSVFHENGSYARHYRETAPNRSRSREPYAIVCNSSAQFIVFPYAMLRSEAPGTMRAMLPVYFLDASGQVIADLGDFLGPEMHATGRGSGGPLPMGAKLLIAVGSERAYVGRSDSSSIMTYRLDGTLMSSIEVPFAPRAATEADRDWYKLVDTLGEDTLIVKGRIRRWSEATFPDRLPAFSEMMVDSEELLWVRGYPHASSATVRWAVMRENGQLAGMVDIPVTLMVSELGKDYILGLDVDRPTGMQRIRAYRLRR